MSEVRQEELFLWIKGDQLDLKDKAFMILYRQYYPVIQKFILQNKGTNEDAKDIFQDALIILHNQIIKGKFLGNSSVKTYLYSVCRNLWLKKITRTKHTLDLIDNQQHVEPSPSALQELIGSEREKVIEEVLDRLGSECNKILKLFYFDKLSMKKIKVHMQLTSEQVAKNKKMKCLKKLRSMVLDNVHYITLLKNEKNG